MADTIKNIKMLTMDLTSGQHKLVTILKDDVIGDESTLSSKKINELLQDLKKTNLGNQTYFIAKAIVTEEAGLSENDIAIVGKPANGNLTGNENSIVTKTKDGLVFIEVKEGVKAYITSEKKDYEFDGTTWKEKVISGVDTNIKEYIASGAVTEKKPLALTSDGKVKTASSADVSMADRIIGFSISTVNDGEKVKVVSTGIIEDSALNLDTVKPLFLGENGGLTQTCPNTGFIHKVGVVKDTKSFEIQLSDYSILL